MSSWAGVYTDSNSKKLVFLNRNWQRFKKILKSLSFAIWLRDLEGALCTSQEIDEDIIVLIWILWQYFLEVISQVCKTLNIENLFVTLLLEITQNKAHVNRLK